MLTTRQYLDQQIGEKTVTKPHADLAFAVCEQFVRLLTAGAKDDAYIGGDDEPEVVFVWTRGKAKLELRVQPNGAAEVAVFGVTGTKTDYGYWSPNHPNDAVLEMVLHFNSVGNKQAELRRKVEATYQRNREALEFLKD